jgi:hypothetical protein
MLNSIEETKFADLKAMCRELKVPSPPEIHIGLKVHDKNGVLVFDDVQRGHSWNRNAWNNFYCGTVHPTCVTATWGAGYLSTKKSSGTVAAWTFPGDRIVTFSAGAIANSDYGILVGTDDTVFSVEQYALIAPITEGTTTGKFSHQAGSVDAGVYTGGTKTWKTTIARIFNNNSGASITVKEVADYAFDINMGSGGFMFERTALVSPVAVANGAQLTVTYEISMDFSAID